ncbi:type VI secretion system-associated protein TagF [Rhizobium lemnae]|uniref:Type VI secretion system-associated protein TagF n=1 Tax=Rhizobium lemnae TaxID=1214924 RepID=A0ABV8EC86_9HYPH|nr:type VI secretion system-associated protein TagF [Rhizobium lemnae]MCJ8510226.1 type VI secretion system-associated protein TagF [Rhizobium lemnae]
MTLNSTARTTPKGEVDRCGFFGKLQTHGDFIAWGLPVELQRRLQDWLQSGLQAAKDNLGPGWHAQFKAMSSWRFIIEEGLWSGQALAGVLVPSVDRVGRDFPFVIMSRIHTFAHHPFQLYKDEDWFTAVEDISARSLRADSSLSDLQDALQQLRSLRPLSGSDHLPRGTARPVKESLWWTVISETKTIQGFRKPGPPVGDDFLRMILPNRIETQRIDLGTLAPLLQSEPATNETAVVRSKRDFQLYHAFHSHPGIRQRVNSHAVLAAPRTGVFAVADGLGATVEAAEVAKLTTHLADQFEMDGPLEAASKRGG